MTTISIPNEIKLLLDEYKMDGETFDDAINRLLDSVESDMVDESLVRGYININVSRDTMERIKSYKIRENEPYGRIILRALLLADNR